MKEIKLTKGKVAIVDDEDYDRLMQLRVKWCMNGPYAYNKAFGLLHRYLMEAPKGVNVDHKNGDALDCRRVNMRFATAAQNQQNRRKKFDGYSKFKGAHWDRGRGWWIARIRANGKLKYLGIFDTDREAGEAYNKAATELFGEYAALNDMENTPTSPLRRQR